MKYMYEDLLKRVQYKCSKLDLSKYNYDELYKLDQMIPTPKEYWDEISDDRKENDNEEN